METARAEARQVWWFRNNETAITRGWQIGDVQSDGYVLVKDMQGNYGHILSGFVHPKNSCDGPNCGILFESTTELVEHLRSEH